MALMPGLDSCLMAGKNNSLCSWLIEDCSVVGGMASLLRDQPTGRPWFTLSSSATLRDVADADGLRVPVPLVGPAPARSAGRAVLSSPPFRTHVCCFARLGGTSVLWYHVPRCLDSTAHSKTPLGADFSTSQLNSQLP